MESHDTSETVKGAEALITRNEKSAVIVESPVMRTRWKRGVIRTLEAPQDCACRGTHGRKACRARTEEWQLRKADDSSVAMMSCPEDLAPNASHHEAIFTEALSFRRGVHPSVCFSICPSAAFVCLSVRPSVRESTVRLWV